MHYPKIDAKETQPAIREGINRFISYDGQFFCIYVPKAVLARPERAMILVSVHGYSGRKHDAKGRDRVQRYAEYWTGLADRKGWVVLAPHFDEDQFKDDYQRLNFSGIRADIRLNDLVEATGRLLPGIPTQRFLLFGFSGGGQFVHRYVAFNPERVERAVCGAPGWYMWPDSNLPYPLGVSPNGFPRDMMPQMRALCETNLLLLVGEKDSTQGAFRRRYNQYDLTRLQGEGRKQRAEKWLAAMQQFAETEHCRFRMAFKIVLGMGHRINQRFLEHAGHFLSGEGDEKIEAQVVRSTKEGGRSYATG
jgi:pimeloyl-ACP methyl ester carboxylesterase